jgi:hypothetical protein
MDNQTSALCSFSTLVELQKRRSAASRKLQDGADHSQMQWAIALRASGSMEQAAAILTSLRTSLKRKLPHRHNRILEVEHELEVTATLMAQASGNKPGDHATVR